MNSTSNRSTRLRYLVAAVVACAALATAVAVSAAAAGGTSVTTIHLVGHETQSKVLSQGGFGDEVIFTGKPRQRRWQQPGGHLRRHAYPG